MLKYISLLLSMFYIVFTSAKTINLNNNNFVSLVGPVTSKSVDDVIKSLNSKNINEFIQENGYINFYIDSPGGSVFAGNHLIQYLKTLQSLDVDINCIGHNFMSMGFAIMQSCTNRYVVFDSIGMQHQMSLKMGGNIENFKSHFSLIERINNMLIDMEVKRINITTDEYKSKILSDWWLFGMENVEHGVADELVTVKCSPAVINEKIKKSESFMGFDFDIEMNKCPLIHDIKIIEKNGSIPNINSNTTKIEDLYDFENYSINCKNIIKQF